MCGVIGVIGINDYREVPYWSAYEAYRGLLTVQHRGQDAAGILTYNKSERRFRGHKKLGLVTQAFGGEEVEKLIGHMSIGHTRYATTGSDGEADLQPMVTGFPFGLGMAHNGNLVNYHDLRKELIEKYHLELLTSNDLEIMMHLWSLEFLKIKKEEKLDKLDFKHVAAAAGRIMSKVDGGYAVVGMMGNLGMFAFRDPEGIRPLVMGEREKEDGTKDYCFVSESIALNFLGFSFVKDIAPGEVVLVTDEGKVHSEVLAKKKKSAHCMFEWIYFSAAESSIDSKSVYSTRLKLGVELSKKIQKRIDDGKLNVDVVCPVPDTSRTASISLAESLGLPYREGLIKNRYVQRSFILNTQEARERAVELKLSPVRSEIEGKNILLVDDSIVRGTTSKQIIKLLKKFGAKDVTLAITSPPLRYGCFYGIDFPNDQDLIANGKDVKEIAKWVGATEVIYLEESDLGKCIGIEGLCMGCVNKKYPTSLEGAAEFSRRRSDHK